MEPGLHGPGNQMIFGDFEAIRLISRHADEMPKIKPLVVIIGRE